MCQGFAGGFISGVVQYPKRILRGVGGLSPNQAAQANQNVQMMTWLYQQWRLPSPQQVSQVYQAYQQIPPPVREGLNLGAANMAGQFAGGTAVSQLVAFYSGRSIANSLGAAFGPQHAIFARTPAAVLVSGLLTYFSWVSANINFVGHMEDTMRQHPQVRNFVEELKGKFEDGKKK
jgi:hypothetical protein